MLLYKILCSTLVIYILFAVTQILQDRNKMKPQLFGIMTVILAAIVFAAFYKFMAKYEMMALHLANITSIIIPIFVVENTTAVGDPLERTDGWIVTVAFQALLSTFQYSKRNDLIYYLLIMVYLWLRTYALIQPLDRYFLLSVYFMIAYCLIYTFSRTFHQHQRDMFSKMKWQKQLLGLFYNLIKIYHDGILISSNDNIILYNKEISRIFEVTAGNSPLEGLLEEG